MVLNNKSPYSSDDEDDDLGDRWEFIEGVRAMKWESDGHRGIDTSANRSDATSPSLEKDEAVESNQNILDDESKQHKFINSVASENEQSAKRNENTDSDDSRDNKSPTDRADEDSNDPTTQLNGEGAIPDRPESPNQHLPLPLHETWTFITSSLRDIDNQNQIRQRTSNSVKKLNTTAQNLWSNLTNETQRIATTLQHHCDQADVQAREASQNISRTVSSTKDSLCRLNTEYKIHEKVAAVAAVSGAILVAAGNPRAGAGSLLVAGGAFAAGEAMSSSSDRGCSTYSRDYGLKEGVHID